MLAESLLIAGAGAIGGLVLARWFSGALVSFLSTDGNRIFINLATDWRTFAFAAALAVSACLLFGLAPALQATATNPGAALQVSGRSGTDSRERFTLRRVLVVVQVALSLVLIAGALLFGRSLRNLTTLDPGFRGDGILIANLDLRRARVAPQGRRQLYTEILDRVRAIPGVRSAAETAIVPVSGSGWNNIVVIDGQPQPESVNLNSVGRGYFATLGTTIVAGRDFDGTDHPGAMRVAIVNRAFARKYFPGRDPLRQSFQIEGPIGEPRPFFHIVGLVEDTKYTDLREPFTPIAFLAAAQETSPPPQLQFILKADAPPSAIVAPATREITAAAPSATVRYATLETQIRDSLVSERLMATLSGFFGGLAVLIATIGLYGVMSYMVMRRRREIGIRIALGADARSVVRMVVTEAGLLLAAGLAAGAVLTVVSARSTSTLLYGLEPTDPATVAFGVVALASVSLIASWIPARRAARFEPTVALRED
jgi:predicted permease